MMKRKVIEDSDDEDNAEATPPPQSPPPISTHDSSAMAEDGTSAIADTLQQSADPSTASTERLKREIRNVHKALIKPTPDSNLPATLTLGSSQHQSESSLTTARGKMRRTKTSVEKLKQRKPLKTYGSQGRDVFEFRGGSDGEVDVTPQKELDLRAVMHQKSSRDGNGDKMGNTWALSSGDTEFFEPRANSMQHKDPKRGKMAGTWALSSGDTEILSLGVKSTDKEPSTGSSMPPPAMKPTAFEQTQRSESSTVARKLKPTPPSPNPTQDTNPFESTYSDGRIPTPTISSRGPGDDQIFQSSDCANTSRKRSRAEMEATDIDQSGLIEPSSSASVLSSGETTMVDKGTQPAIVAQEGKTTEDSGTSTTKPVVLFPHVLQNDDGQDELSLPATTSENASKGQVKTSKEKDKGRKHMDELGSDDTGIGLPKEHYQPRPSKSRSGRGDDGIIVPADYSKRPEAIVKKKRKLSRRKTTAFHELIPKEEDEDEIVTWPSLRPPGSKAIETIKEQDELDLEEKDKAKNIHDGCEPEDKPTAKPTVPAKQRGRPKKRANEASENRSTGDDGLDVQEKEGQEKRKDTEPDSEPEAEPKPANKPTESKKQRGRPKKGAAEASNTKTSDEKQDELDQSNPAPTKAKADMTSKKPRNKGEALKAISEELIHDSDDDPLAADESKELPRNILHETQGKVVLTKPIEGAHASPSPPKPMSAPPETPHKGVAFHKGPDKHSPISSGKVAYRVGLSKRARIEPLLRVVRKV